MNAQTTPFWSDPDRYMAGSGEILRFDPGTGPLRYRHALEWLRTTDRKIAFASFTFDANETGSVVMAPEHIDQSRALVETDLPHGGVVDDGAEQWNTGFVAALGHLTSNSLEKVVLARQIEIQFASTVPAETVLARLIADNPSTYAFLVDGLVGASPELLVSLDGNRISSLVLAGTAATPDGLDNAKTSVEHDLAAESVELGLGSHAESVTQERSVLRFGELNHVGTQFSAVANQGTSVLDLVASLHPTAAVAGTPTGHAVELIREIEPRPRGRYAGPVGWFDRDGNGEFTIALRCGLIEDDRVTLYSGGGLVAASDRTDEWQETELKLGPMLAALGVD